MDGLESPSSSYNHEGENKFGFQPGRLCQFCMSSGMPLSSMSRMRICISSAVRCSTFLDGTAQKLSLRARMSSRVHPLVETLTGLIDSLVAVQSPENRRQGRGQAPFECRSPLRPCRPLGTRCTDEITRNEANSRIE